MGIQHHLLYYVLEFLFSLAVINNCTQFLDSLVFYCYLFFKAANKHKSYHVRAVVLKVWFLGWRQPLSVSLTWEFIRSANSWYPTKTG